MNQLKKNPSLFILILACILFSVPFFFCQGLPFGNDLSFHLSRLESLKTALLNGSILPGVYSDYFSGMGYGNGLFYPDLFLYIPVFMMCLGISTVNAMKLYLILLSSAAAFSMYGSLRSIKASQSAAMFSAFMILFASYHITDIYLRCSLGEIQAFVFLPMIFAGLIDLLWGQGKNPLLLMFGFSGLILSHILTSVITFLISSVLTLCCFKHLLTEPFRFKTLGLAALGSLGLTAFFTFPMLEQMILNPIWGDVGLNGTVSSWAVPLNQLFLAKPQLLGAEGVLPAGIGLPLVFCGILGLMSSEKPLKVFALIGWILLWMASDLFPWSVLESRLQIFQFPWRLYLLTTLCWAFVAGPALEQRIRSVKIKRFFVGLLSLLMLLSFGIQVSFIYQHYPCIEENPYPTFPAGCEYLPEALSYAQLLESEKNLKSEERLGWQCYLFELTEKDPEIPVIYYPGYRAWLIKDGTRFPVTLSASEHGLIRIDTDQGGEVLITYQKTALAQATLWISLFSVLLIFIMIFRRKKPLDL